MLDHVLQGSYRFGLGPGVHWSSFGGVRGWSCFFPGSNMRHSPPGLIWDLHQSPRKMPPFALLRGGIEHQKESPE